MKTNLTNTPITVARLATSEEIRAAVLPFPDPIEECSKEMLCEIAADTGGYVRISALEFEASALVEEWIEQQDLCPN